MKVIIAGGRFYKPTVDHKKQVILILQELGATEIVSGKAPGADKFGEDLAGELNLPVAQFPATWSVHGRSAGPKRNEAMAKYADVCILLPGGAGTRSMKKFAIKYKLILKEIK